MVMLRAAGLDQLGVIGIHTGLRVRVSGFRLGFLKKLAAWDPRSGHCKRLCWPLFLYYPLEFVLFSAVR